MDCNIIRDLMPLFIENLSSEASNKLLLEHVNDCEECSEILKKLQADLTPVKTDEVLNINDSTSDDLLKRIKKNILKKISVLAAIAFAIGTIIGISSSNGFMFLAFYGTVSVFTFTLAVFSSVAICRNQLPSRRKFHFIGNWTVVFSILISFILFYLFRGFFNEVAKKVIIIFLEVIYNIILSSTLRIYAWRKLPTDDASVIGHVIDRNLYSVLFSTVIAVMVMVAVPVTLLEKYRVVDNISLAFENDPDVLGKWVSVDFVRTPEGYVPGRRPIIGELFLKEMIFLDNGKLSAAYGEEKIDTSRPWLNWTKGFIMHKGGDHTASKYLIKKIDGVKYLFFEWKSGDVLYFHKPSPYYVLKKAEPEESAAAKK
jgi:hypothetical protein